jgi:signal peptidase I
MKKLSIRKTKKITSRISAIYRKKRKNLTDTTKHEFETIFINLKNSIRDKDKKACYEEINKLKALADRYLKRSFFIRFIETVFGIAIALLIAIIIRQMWFEFYNIPSGSMRPTFKEKDYVVVTKNNFGLNLPLKNNHLYFNENLLKRGNIVVFNGGGMDIPDVDTMYFFIFPGKKQFIKRLIAKPGDSIYFYGGKIYGVDKHGKKIDEYDSSLFEEIEHIPFIRFDGKVIANTVTPTGSFSPVYIYQMNEPIAKLSVNSYGSLNAEMLTENSSLKYADLWGFKNFGTTKILTSEDVKEFLGIYVEPGSLYLEITHHPRITPISLIKDQYSRLRPDLSYSKSIIQLKENHLNSLMSHISTSRFVVNNNKAYRYGSYPSFYSIEVKGIENGVYEFDNGTLYKVQLDSLLINAPQTVKNIFNILPFGGFLKKMPKNHPLYDFSNERIQLLYNVGIEWNKMFIPTNKNQYLSPSRYTYFRDGDLYLLGKPIYLKDDPTLIKFVENENQLEKNLLTYEPFVDSGPPVLDNNELDIKKIVENGLKIPKKSYLVLGDNHANSSDSRDFGFVPQGNLKGSSNVIFWPPSRWGRPIQPHFPMLSFPKIFIWTMFLIVIIISLIIARKRKLY